MTDSRQAQRGPWPIAQFNRGLTQSNFQLAIADLLRAWQTRALWSTLAIQDIRLRYRRSVLGPFWLTVSIGVMVAALGILYGAIFRQDLSDYLPYLAAGFVIWGLISQLVLDGSNAFIGAEGLIRQLNAPLSIYTFRAVASSLLVFAHNIWVFFAVALWFNQWPGWALLFLPISIAIILINGLWISLLLGLISTRFRDIPQIIASIVQVMFFITPIIWKVEMLPERALILELNPFWYMIEIARAPLLGYLPSVQVLLATLAITVLGWLLALAFYTVYRWRIPYWI